MSYEKQKFNFPFAGLILAAFPTDPATEKRENVAKEIRNTINLKCREYAYKQKQSQQKKDTSRTER